MKKSKVVFDKGEPKMRLSEVIKLLEMLKKSNLETTNFTLDLCIMQIKKKGGEYGKQN